MVLNRFDDNLCLTFSECVSHVSFFQTIFYHGWILTYMYSKDPHMHMVLKEWLGGVSY